MITNKYRYYDGEDNQDTLFIISNSEQNMWDEFKEYCKQHPNDEIWYYVNPVVPSMINLRPEYSIELMINPKGFVMFARRWQ